MSHETDILGYVVEDVNVLVMHCIPRDWILWWTFTNPSWQSVDLKGKTTTFTQKSAFTSHVEYYSAL